MYNCDHCQKKYKRSWHQARHNQMKHENSNTSTATTSSSAETPPTPEINGNLNLPSANTINNNNNSPNNNNNTIASNNNFNYQQAIHQQTATHQSQPSISQDISNIAQNQPSQPQQIQQQQQQQQQGIPRQIMMPGMVGNHQMSPQPQHTGHNSPQAHHQTHLNYGSEMMDTTKSYAAHSPMNSTVNNGQYVHYAVNEQQYTNKYEIQNPAAQQVSYDSWVSVLISLISVD